MSDPGDIPDDEALAGEYVLGVLAADVMAQCAARRRTDRAFDRLVSEWETRLMPAAALVTPVAPPPELLGRIEGALRPGLTPDTPLLEALRRQLRLWRGIAGAGLVAAGVLGGIVLTRPAPAPRVVAVLLPPGAGTGGFLVRELGPAVRLDPVRPMTVPPGRDFELWTLAAGAAAPRSLGVLPSGGEALPPGTWPDGDVQLLVSLEPAGGSPSGAPTGPVVLAAELHGTR